MVEDKCPKCGSVKLTEIITKGITQTVFWDGDRIVKEINEYNEGETDDYVCTDCGEKL